MRLATCEQSQKIDLETFSRAETHSDILNSYQMMNLAAQKCAEVFLQKIKPKSSDQIAILIGPGNNGKDGQLVADILIVKKFHCRIFLWHQLNMEEFDQLKQFDLLIDAVFGIGLNRQLSNIDIEKLKKIDDLKLPIFAIDTPTGLNLNTGQNWGYCLKAIWTYAMGFYKPGYYLNDGPEKCGKIIHSKLPYPQDILRKNASTHFLMTEKMKNRIYPHRPNSSSKAEFGNAIIIGSSQQLIGAGVLASIAAARIGAGFVTLAPIEVLKNYKIEYPEFLYRPWKYLSKEILHSQKIKAIGIGPGLGKNTATLSILKKLLPTKHQVVVDADALAGLSSVKKLNQNWVITPHRLELSRILNVDAKDINNDPIRYALIAAQKWNCVVLLKGFHTVIAMNNQCLIIPTGNSALAKAGSGDVLTGIIIGLMAQGLTPFRAACLGSYIHGQIADNWIHHGNSIHSLMPSDLLNALKTIRHFN